MQVPKNTYFQLLDPFSATSSLNCVMGEKLLLVHSRVNLFSDLPAASEFHTGEDARPAHEEVIEVSRNSHEVSLCQENTPKTGAFSLLKH